MNEPQIGDLFDSPPHEYLRRVRIIGREGDRYLVENIHTKVKTRLGPATLRRWRPVVAERGGK